MLYLFSVARKLPEKSIFAGMINVYRGVISCQSFSNWKIEQSNYLLLDLCLKNMKLAKGAYFILKLIYLKFDISILYHKHG